jgi:hypothetical protein
VLAGFFGLAVLAAFILAKKWDVGTVLMLGAFCGLTLGYAFGGDIWGARLFNFFTGQRVHVPEKSNPDSSPQDKS